MRPTDDNVVDFRLWSLLNINGQTESSPVRTSVVPYDDVDDDDVLTQDQVLVISTWYDSDVMLPW